MSGVGLKTYLEAQRKWLQDFLFDILSIPSESGKEGAVQLKIMDLLKDLDASCEMAAIGNDIMHDPEYSDSVKDLDYSGRFNLKVVKAGTGSRTFVINSHVDVVPPSIGQKDPFVPYMDEEGNVYARGACDAKGQIAAMALLIKAACEYKSLKPTIILHSVVEEEFGGNGTLAMLRHEKDFHPDALINMEPTNLRLMTSIRGAVWFNMRFYGKSGHAGSADNTENAIYKAIRAVGILQEYHESLKKESLGYGLFAGMDNPMPLTIGQLASGEWPSMVPNQAVLRGVMGFLPNKTRDAVIQGLKEAFGRPENRWVGDGMELHFDYRHNAVELPVSHWFAEGMSKACRKCGLNAVPTAMTASTDAVFYSEMGIPALAFGPGELKYAHSAEEHIRIDDILKAAEVLYTFFEYEPVSVNTEKNNQEGRK